MAKQLPLRERILKEAGELFLSKGFHRVTLLKVVSRARTSKSSIYKYFRSKEHLVATLVEQLNSIIDRQYEGIVHNADLGFEQKLEALTRFSIKLGELVSPAFEEDLREQAPELWKTYQKQHQDRVKKFLRPLFRQGVREEVLRKDVQLDLLLSFYLQLLRLATRPDPSMGIKTDKAAWTEHLNTLFLEGSLEA